MVQWASMVATVVLQRVVWWIDSLVVKEGSREVCGGARRSAREGRKKKMMVRSSEGSGW